MSVIYRERLVSVPADQLGKSKTDPPDVVEIDNVILYAFTVDTDKMMFKMPIRLDYYAGAIEFYILWTNDGGVDDNGKDTKWQLDYQTAAEGDPVDGSHVNSPKVMNDTYASDVGWIEHHTEVITIAEADFAGKYCIYLKLSAITPDGVALTCEPHLIGLCFKYQVRINYV